MSFTLHLGDCLDVMRNLPDNSVDSICTDPPYGLSFMNHHWDYAIPGVEIWKECLRVLKPGGHLLSFAGTRTHHRMAVSIEDAGFEIRDMIAWVYGSGFPKSMDVSKAIDKAAGAEREVIGERKGTGNKTMCQVENGKGFGETVLETAPATPEAEQWQGWGTALKPAIEPITLARKPLAAKTVAANVLAHSTGAMNIDACRVPLTGATDAATFENNHRVTERLPQEYDGQNLGLHDGGWKQRVGEAVIPTGRWPANLVHDGSEEVLAAFPEAKGQLAKASTSNTQRAGQNCYGQMVRGSNGQEPRVESERSAARFFYCAKATSRDRHEGLSRPCAQFKHGGTLREVENTETKGNSHPTVKPTDLMRYLCRLITPPGGVVLDPFLGSGSTGKAAMLEGFKFIGIEREAAYMEIARARIAFAAAEDLL